MQACVHTRIHAYTFECSWKGQQTFPSACNFLVCKKVCRKIMWNLNSFIYANGIRDSAVFCKCTILVHSNAWNFDVKKLKINRDKEKKQKSPEIVFIFLHLQTFKLCFVLLEYSTPDASILTNVLNAKSFKTHFVVWITLRAVLAANYSIHQIIGGGGRHLILYFLEYNYFIFWLFTVEREFQFFIMHPYNFGTIINSNAIFRWKIKIKQQFSRVRIYLYIIMYNYIQLQTFHYGVKVTCTSDHYQEEKKLFFRINFMDF